MEISHENSKILVNDPDQNKGNSNNLTIDMYNKNKKKSNHVYILGLH